MRESYKIWIVLLAFVGLALLVYSPHFDYGFPFHLDEWIHLSYARDVTSSGLDYFIEGFNPVEIGFHFILILIGLFFPLIEIFEFLPALNSIAIGFILFYFLNKKYGYWAAIFGILFLASLKSNVNVLGLWFFAPFTAAITLNYLFLFFLESSKEDIPGGNRYIILALISLLILSLVHASSALLLTFVFLIWCYFERKFVFENYRQFMPYFLILIPAMIVFYNRADFSSIYQFFGIFAWGVIDPLIIYNPFTFYGTFASVFALYGFCVSYLNKRLLGLRIYYSVSLVSLLIFPLIHLSVFSAYQRYLYHFLVASVPFSAIGLYSFLISFNKWLKVNEINFWIRRALIILFVLTCFFSTFSGYYELDNSAELYRLINENDYHAMTFLESYERLDASGFVYDERYGPVISQAFPGTAMNAVVGLDSFYNIRRYYTSRREVVEDFFEGDCNEKKNILKIWSGIKYVYSYGGMDCDFLESIYDAEGVWIYRVDV